MVGPALLSGAFRLGKKCCLLQAIRRALKAAGLTSPRAIADAGAVKPQTRYHLVGRLIRREAMTAPTPEEQRWHWGEGNKYALEAMKALLWLNGGSAAALLTFFGARVRLITPAFGEAIVSFGLGAALSVLVFVMAYFVQLDYGNKGITLLGQRIHNLAYIPLVGSLAAFLWGLWFAFNAIVPALGA
jgi:preprotein translocase subunit SecD